MFSDEIKGLGDKLYDGARERFHSVQRSLGNTRNFLRRTRNQQKETARKQRFSLNRFQQDLSKNTGKLLSDAEKLVSNFESRRDELRKNQNHFLRSFQRKNEQQVTHFMDKCHGKREELRRDFDRAHSNLQRAMRNIARCFENGRFPQTGTNGDKPFKPGTKKSMPRRKNNKG